MADGAPTCGPTTAEELRDALWIRTPTPTLDHDASQDIRTEFLRALERGVTRIVVDLTGVTEVRPEGIDLLEAAADELLAKHGTLWLANDAGESLRLGAVEADGLQGLRGLSSALASALEESRRPTLGLSDDGRTGR